MSRFFTQFDQGEPAHACSKIGCEMGGPWCFIEGRKTHWIAYVDLKWCVIYQIPAKLLTFQKCQFFTIYDINIQESTDKTDVMSIVYWGLYL